MSSLPPETPLVPPAHVKAEVDAALGDAFKNLRYYQREAIECCATRLLKTKGFLLIELPTGSGKSWVIAGLASVLHKFIRVRTGRGKKILVLAPSAELVEQNHQKLVEAGFEASIYMANLGKKDLSADIVFGSPISVGNSVDSMVEDAHEFGAIVIDESHEFTPKIRYTIERLRQVNPNLRVIGLTATPYRMGTGFIYERNVYVGGPQLTSNETKDPPFAELVYQKTAKEMIEEGFMAPPLVGDIQAHYDTSALARTAGGDKFTEKSNNAVFVDGKEDTTRQIVLDVVKKSENRKSVMIFAQNRKHACLILSILDEIGEVAALVDTDTDHKVDRPRIIKNFKAHKIRYLINVGTLIKGFDSPSLDVIAILAHTESDARLQQIIGRGLRISPETNKKDCLVLDYGENLNFSGDVLSPKIRVGSSREQRGTSDPVEVICPTCKNVSEFPMAKAMPGTVMNDNGYLVSSDSNTLVSTDKGEPIAGHLGSKCSHYYYPAPDSLPIKCPQTWGVLECEDCGALNGHRAADCLDCGAPIRDLRLSLIPSRPDGPYSPRLANVIGDIRMIPGSSKSGNPTLRIALQVQELPYFALRRFAIDQSEDSSAKDGDPVSFDDPDTAYEEREVLVQPAKEDIQVWLNPTIKHPKAQAGWNAFIQYASCYVSGDQLEVTEENAANLLARFANEHPNRLPVASPKFITYCQQKTGQNVTRTFYEILDFHDVHPYVS